MAVPPNPAALFPPQGNSTMGTYGLWPRRPVVPKRKPQVYGAVGDSADSTSPSPVAPTGSAGPTSRYFAPPALPIPSAHHGMAPLLTTDAASRARMATDRINNAAASDIAAGQRVLNPALGQSPLGAPASPAPRGGGAFGGMAHQSAGDTLGPRPPKKRPAAFALPWKQSAPRRPGGSSYLDPVDAYGV